MVFILPDYIYLAIELLEKNNYQCYLVGGCVRDSLLGTTPSDWDISTDALPQEVERCFLNYKSIDTGKKHGTITVLIGKNKIEITTMRDDGEYLNHRSPQAVSFTKDIKSDLSRRDFTVNALAYNPKTGIIDFFEGQKDIANKTLRCVGNASERFGEDALRILRLFRFSSQLEFSIDSKALLAAKEMAKDIAYLSKERINAELSKLLISARPSNALKLMLGHGILKEIIPQFEGTKGFEQHSIYHDKTLDEHIFAAVDEGDRKLEIRLSLLLHDIAKSICFNLDKEGRGHFKGHGLKGAELAETILENLRYDKKTINKVATLIKLHDIKIPTDEKEMRRLISAYNKELVADLLNVIKADTLAKNPLTAKERLCQIDNAGIIFETVLSKKPCLSIAELDINGNDLMSLGIVGEEIGKMLELLLEQVVENPEKNNKKTLIMLLSNIKG